MTAESYIDFIQANSPDGGFLQSDFWRKFQERFGRKTFHADEKDAEGNIFVSVNVIIHKLPIAGEYFYIPRGPVLSNKIINSKNQIYTTKIKKFLDNLIVLARENNIGWIRIEPNSEKELDFIKSNLPDSLKTKKLTVDVQPREILILDVTKSEKELLSQMKQKTRYNIKLSQKRGVTVKVISNFQFPSSERYIKEFLRLVKITAERDKIKSHPESYYCKMFEAIPPEILKMDVAEYKGKIIAANLVLFFGKTATFMHGASDDIHRNAMAPYLLQWQQILDAKRAGCTKYDFGGVSTHYSLLTTHYKKWSGITKFKTGFAPEIKPVEFPGCYDIVLDSGKYNSYRILQKIRKLF